MLKFASTGRRISFLFLAAVALSILCNSMVVNGETDETDETGEIDEIDETGGIDETDGVDEIDEGDGLQAPRCVYRCSRPYQPVCGSDGRTYGNICHLNTKNRCDNTNIRKVSDGTCPRQRCVRDPRPLVCNQCARNSCFVPLDSNRFCTRCTNLNCNNNNSPVCGTNGVTYRNDCQLAVRTSADCVGYPVRLCRRGPCSPRNILTDFELEK